MAQSVQDLLNAQIQQILAGNDPNNYAGGPSFPGTYGNLPQTLQNEQLQKAVMNTSNPNPTGQNLYFGGAGGNGTGQNVGGDTITPDNPYYSYFQNINPADYSKTPASIMNPAFQWNQAHYAGLPNQNDTSSVGTGQALNSWNNQLQKNIDTTQGLINQQTNQNKASSGFFHNPLNIWSLIAANLLPGVGPLVVGASQLAQAGRGFSEGNLGAGFGNLIGAGLSGLNGAGGLSSFNAPGASTINPGIGTNYSPGSLVSNYAGAIPQGTLDTLIQGGVGAGIGAGTSALSGSSPLGGAVSGGAGGALSAQGGLTGLAKSLNIDSMNPFGASNVAPGGPSTNMGMTASNSVPLPTSDMPSNDNFFSRLFGSSSASNISGNSSDNIAGVPQSQSLFDQAGSYVSNNPLTTIAGLATAGAGLSSAFGSSGPESSPSSDLGQSLSAFTPQQHQGLAAPNSLANYTSSALSPDQTLSGIATQGVYGRGNGPEEQKYFLNLINNRLVDPMGNVANDMSGINPVENSYLAQLGLGGYSNPTDLMRGISNYAA